MAFYLQLFAALAFIVRCIWRGITIPSPPGGIDNSTVSIPFGAGPSANVGGSGFGGCDGGSHGHC